ncbi:hypothetical protein ACFYYD_00475 [Streptomyces bluensis]|uniref:hypothetical protein n=1 Tax=Streptomyces bluensis TaxID=33897 RepID=UPI0036A5BFBD
MTHLHGKHLPGPERGPGHGRILATVIGLVAALGLGTIGEAAAAPVDRAAATMNRLSELNVHAGYPIVRASTAIGRHAQTAAELAEESRSLTSSPT